MTTKVPIELVDLDSGVVINESSADVDFRVESNGNANMLFVDGGNDRVGINGTGTNARGGSNTVALVDVSSSGENYFEIQGATDSTANGLLFSDGSSGNYGVVGYNHASDNMNFFTAGSERVRIESDGRFGIGTTAPQLSFVVSDGGGYGFEVSPNHTVNSAQTTLVLSYDRANSTYRSMTIAANELIFGYGQTASNEAMRINSSGHVGIGTNSPTTYSLSGTHVELLASTANEYTFFHVNTNSVKSFLATNDSAGLTALFTYSSHPLTFGTGNSEKVRIDTSGNLLVGTTNNSNSHKVCINGSLGVITSGNGNRNFQVFTVSNENWNVADTLMRCGKNGTTGRSINAGGTINASGADYAEYMKKADSCGTIAKGDVCGVDSTGKLTDVFNNSISFVIKSTDPSYVGGDTWGSVDLNLSDEQAETERQKHDRIAFSGQVPVNITGSFNVGDYVYPQANGTAIQCVAKSNPTFEEYQLCVGKIWATQSDGRPLVAVKIG